MTDDCLKLSNASWISDFVKKHGRKPKILHVGNIANNAYLNAKFLNDVGLECHVLCPGYDHVMGTPEWEDIEIHRPYGDDNKPKFHSEDVGVYKRPSWFVSGSLYHCMRTLYKLNGKVFLPNAFPSKAAALYFRAHPFLAKIFGDRITRIIFHGIFSPRSFMARIVKIIAWQSEKAKKRILCFKSSNKINIKKLFFLADYLTYYFFHILTQIMYWAEENLQKYLSIFLAIKKSPSFSENYIQLFDKYFPQRPDRLSQNDFTYRAPDILMYKSIIEYYDIVQAYALEPINIMLAQHTNYVCFEHGTLRDFTIGDDSVHRWVSLAYRHSRHSFITNGDSIHNARSIGLKHFSGIIHPIDVAQHRIDYSADAEGLRTTLGASHMIFCPARQDWSVKGNDNIIKAIPGLREDFGEGIIFVFADWGGDMDASRALIKELDIERYVVWKTPMCRIAMIKYLQAADVVIDQMVLPVFGSTGPQALAAGTPVVSSYIPEETAWLFPEPAPILSAFTSDDVRAQVHRAVDPAWRATFREEALRWIDTFHSPKNVVDEHLRVYGDIITSLELTS